jgi:acyl-CoA thioester hydrolase
VGNLKIRFKSPALYDDEIVVRTRLTNIRPYLLRFRYEVMRASDHKLLAEGETTHFIVDEEFKITRLPQKYLTAFAQASTE